MGTPIVLVFPMLKKRPVGVYSKMGLLMRELVTLNPITVYRCANSNYGFCCINVPLESIVSEYRRYLYLCKVSQYRNEYR